MISDWPCARMMSMIDPVRFVRVARPVHLAAGARAALLELLEIEIEIAEHVVLDVVRRLAQLLPVGHLADDGRALVPNDGGGVADVAAQLDVGEGVPGRRRKIGRRGGVADANHRPAPGCLRWRREAPRCGGSGRRSRAG